MSQKGFTLVEMAIVIVIIGVLIGGAMKGMAFINIAKAKKVITDATGLIDAQHKFYEREKRYAGDADNNGLIDYTSMAAGVFDDAATTSSDPDFAFNELKGFGIFSNNIANSIIGATQEAGVMHYAGITEADAAGNTLLQNMVVIRNVTCLAAFQLEQNIDKDDPGTPNSAGLGFIRMISAAGAISTTGQWTSANTACVVGGVVSDTALTNVAFIFR